VICASVIQGSLLGPASYVVTAADLHPVHKRNCIFKYADDTYLIVPAVNTDTCQEEIDDLQTWACSNNLTLNKDKTKEIVYTVSLKRAPPQPRWTSSAFPPCESLASSSTISLRQLTM